jgi:hypothetical protein
MKSMNYILFLLLIMTALNMQAQPDTIQVKKKLGTVFQVNGINVTPDRMLEIMEINPAAYAEMKIAKTNYVVSMAFGAGGLVLGYFIGASASSGDPNWTRLGVSAGMIVASIPFGISYTKHARNAVSIYNSDIRNSYRNIPEMTLNIAPYGAGLKLRF